MSHNGTSREMRYEICSNNTFATANSAIWNVTYRARPFEVTDAVEANQRVVAGDDGVTLVKT